MNNKLLLGSKYYRYDENNNLEIIRIYKNNDLEVKVFVDNDKDNKFKMSIKELEEKYIRLNPHAFINFCIAKVRDDLSDVIVTMHKMHDLAHNDPIPACVCRQNITDLFANNIIVLDKMYVGCCMSLQTCPPDIDYGIMVACNGFSKTTTVCTYMDDTLDNILGMVNTREYDRTLESLFADHINYEVEKKSLPSMVKTRMMKLESYDGYCKSLKTLLEENNFMYDFYRAFNIVPITEEVIYDKGEGTVSNNIVDIISDIYQVNIVSTLCMEYWYDIDLDNIDNDHILIMDKNDNLYVIAFVSIGPKHIEVENIESDENIQRLIDSTIGSNKSIKEAAEHIRFNKNKYNN